VVDGAKPVRSTSPDPRSASNAPRRVRLPIPPLPAGCHPTAVALRREFVLSHALLAQPIIFWKNASAPISIPGRSDGSFQKNYCPASSTYWISAAFPLGEEHVRHSVPLNGLAQTGYPVVQEPSPYYRRRRCFPGCSRSLRERIDRALRVNCPVGFISLPRIPCPDFCRSQLYLVRDSVPRATPLMQLGDCGLQKLTDCARKVRG